jgi:hypothetical protein
LASFILFCRINGIAFKSILRDDRVDAASKERSSASCGSRALAAQGGLVLDNGHKCPWMQYSRILNAI